MGAIKIRLLSFLNMSQHSNMLLRDLDCLNPKFPHAVLGFHLQLPKEGW